MADTVSSADVTTLGDPIYAGEGKWFKFTVEIDGAAVDLSGATFGFSIKENLSDTSFVFQASAGDFDDLLAASGIIRVNLPASTTVAMDPGTYWGELETTLVSDTDVDKKLVKFKIKQAVTP
jgi:hypothetical protein